MVPYFDSPVSTTAGKDTLMEGVPANSMYCHVVGLQWIYRVYTIFCIMYYVVHVHVYVQCYVDDFVLTKQVNKTG